MNPYTDTTANIRKLLIESRKQYAASVFAEAVKQYGRQEAERQIMAQSGPIVDKINEVAESLAKKTENVELITGLGLADLYFGPDSKTSISFEMKPGFAGGKLSTYADLIANIATSTHIDCSISDGKQNYDFQIKRYPQAYLEHTNEAFLKWLEEVLQGYSEMSGTTLVIILQPNIPPTQKTLFDFPRLSSELSARSNSITFDGIALTYTDSRRDGEYSVLHRIYPKNEKAFMSLPMMLKRFRGEI